VPSVRLSSLRWISEVVDGSSVNAVSYPKSGCGILCRAALLSFRYSPAWSGSARFLSSIVIGITDRCPSDNPLAPQVAARIGRQSLVDEKTMCGNKRAGHHQLVILADLAPDISGSAATLLLLTR
jgi:hypothetical protein